LEGDRWDLIVAGPWDDPWVRHAWA